jgi:hypothetical protein
MTIENFSSTSESVPDQEQVSVVLENDSSLSISVDASATASTYSESVSETVTGTEQAKNDVDGTDTSYSKDQDGEVDTTNTHNNELEAALEDLSAKIDEIIGLLEGQNGDSTSATADDAADQTVEDDTTNTYNIELEAALEDLSAKIDEIIELIGGQSDDSSSATADDAADQFADGEMPANGEMPPDGEMPTDMDTDSTVEKSGVSEQDGGSVTESDKTYSATETDESAVYVYDGADYTLSDSVLEKTGDTSSDANSNFYGNNAIVLVEDQSTMTLTDSTLYSDADGSNGVFAYGEGSTVYVSGSTIETHGNSSRGVDATYGGTVEISDSVISTEGNHSAALATDRYDDQDPPTIIADNVTGQTAGDGSPGIYSTGTFSVSNSNLTATGSEAAVVEGKNSITLTDSTIEGAAKWGVIVYQSTSGDSSEGMGTFDMTGGALTNNSSGPTFMVCNTEATINLEDVDIESSGDVLIRATDASSGDDNINSDWGTAGGDVTLTATDQELEGTVSCNKLSGIDMSLSGTSTLSGDVVVEEGGQVNVALADDAKWTATGDSKVDELEGVEFSGGVPTNVDAPSGVTITYASGSGLSGDYTLASGGKLVSE